MMIFGQSRYLDYEVSPGCGDCSNVFPQGLDLLRLIASQCDYADIAREPGVYDWTVLDKQLDACEERGVQVLYCMCYTPEWAYRTDYVPEWPDPGIRSPHSNYPPRLDEFEDFVRNLIIHCTRPDGSNRIAYIEAWNETNALSFWNGTNDILLEQQKMLWRVIQELAPTILLTTPTPTKNKTSVEHEIDKYLAMGFQHFSHIVTFHGYTEVGAPGDAIAATLEAVHAVMAKHNCRHPLWDTEFGWTQGFSDDGSIPMSEVPQWIEDALVVRLKHNIACAVWFQWDNPNNCGTMCSWRGEINEAGAGWMDLYHSVHPLPPVADLTAV